MADGPDLLSLLRAVGRREHAVASQILRDHPELVVAKVARADEFFLEESRAQVYAGDTALHAAAFAYDGEFARRLVEAGADVRARNRRGAEPLHAAITGGPGSDPWNPVQQVAVIEYLVSVGADPNALAAGGVTPLHRAVRNRCSSAVAALLMLGADPNRANDNGSTAFDLAGWTTGRPGTGWEEARAEQQKIIDILSRSTA